MVPSFFPMAIFRRFLVVEHHYLRPHQKLRGACAIVRCAVGMGKKYARPCTQAPIEYQYNYTTACVHTHTTTTGCR